MDWIESAIRLSDQERFKLALSLGVIVLLWLARRIALAIIKRRSDDLRVHYQWKKGTTYLTVPLAAMLIGWIWIEHVTSLATYLGLLSAGIAIALKDLLVNLAAWAFILWRRPFEVGDRIEIGTTAGDVIDQRIFQFTVMEIGNWVHADQSTGRIIHLPNGAIFNLPLANYTKGFQFIWNELPVLVTFESNWKKAKEILQRIADEQAGHLSEEAQEQVRVAARRFMIFYSKLTPIVYTSVEDSGVLLTVRYLSRPRARRSSAQAIWEETLQQFALAPDIDFAYPTHRFYDNRAEGKRGLVAEAAPPGSTVETAPVAPGSEPGA